MFLQILGPVPISFSASFLAAILTGACTYVIYQCFFHPLASFPGPLSAKVTKIWRAYGMYKGTWHRDLVDLHRKYGPVVRIGPNELCIGDPDAFRQIYSVTNTFPKGACYSVIQGTRPFDLANERNEKIHAAQRRVVARPYSMESTKRFEPLINELTETLLEKLDNFATSSQTIDLGFWIQLYAFDVIGVVSFSKPFGFVSSGSDNGIFERIQRAMNSAAWLMHARWFFKFHQSFIMPVFGNWLALNDRHGYFFEFSKEQVNGRKGQEGTDIVGQLFHAQATKSQPDDLSITFMMTTNVFAGSDTTAIAMSAIFLYLVRSPHVVDTLRAELRERHSNLRGIVSSEEAESSPYLQAIIYEGMRVFPSLAFVMDRDVPPEGMTIGGKHIPGGVSIQ
ncbi:putative cytochrome P450 family protein [Rosellinia necatrix]|uniref:Putative cytochrome P450 family protein n=1 Tax=Rosellinia necatrix TaxID=77044 RepID=A0A1S7UNU0_ROSNE|nr:putative cytochrome P450 family protein [Rosellinia necatrix]